MRPTQAKDSQSQQNPDERQLQMLKNAWQKLGQNTPQSVTEGDDLSVALSRLFLGVTISQMEDCISK